MIQAVSPNIKHFDGKVLIPEVNEIYGLSIDDSELDTIGGWILSQNSEIQEQEIISFDGYDFKVIELDGHQVKKIEVSKRISEEEHEDLQTPESEQNLIEKEA